MPGVSKEQVEMARAVDLLTYLQINEPRELRRSGPNEYRTASHGSLVISNGLWRWNRGGFGGRSALDYLIKVRGMGFVDAVEAVLGCQGAHIGSGQISQPSPVRHFSAQSVEKANPPPQKTLSLPPPARFPTHMLSYLQRRGIKADIISKCVSAGILYESRYNGSPVCVFVGHDNDGNAANGGENGGNGARVNG